MNFTSDGSVSTHIISHSSQQRRSSSLLDGSLNFLKYCMTLANLAKKYGWVKPEFCATGNTHIEGGYHPLLLMTVELDKITCNDVDIDDSVRVVAVTGPNMAGKSTFIRNVGLISLLGQAGSYVHATRATLPVYTDIRTYFGSQDNLLEKTSLFQKEMLEINRNLKDHKKGSLLICDELFRGTEAGSDGGMLLHSAMVEALALDYTGRTILSSHYHDALRSQQNVPRVKFLKTEVDESGNPLYKVSEGIGIGGYSVRSALKAGIATPIARRLSGGILPEGYREAKVISDENLYSGDSSDE